MTGLAVRKGITISELWGSSHVVIGNHACLVGVGLSVVGRWTPARYCSIQPVVSSCHVSVILYGSLGRCAAEVGTHSPFRKNATHQFVAVLRFVDKRMVGGERMVDKRVVCAGCGWGLVITGDNRDGPNGECSVASHLSVPRAVVVAVSMLAVWMGVDRRRIDWTTNHEWNSQANKGTVLYPSQPGG